MFFIASWVTRSRDRNRDTQTCRYHVHGTKKFNFYGYDNYSKNTYIYYSYMIVHGPRTLYNSTVSCGRKIMYVVYY